MAQAISCGREGETLAAAGLAAALRFGVIDYIVYCNLPLNDSTRC